MLSSRPPLPPKLNRLCLLARGSPSRVDQSKGTKLATDCSTTENEVRKRTNSSSDGPFLEPKIFFPTCYEGMWRFVFIKMGSLEKGRVGQAMLIKKDTSWCSLQEGKRSESIKEREIVETRGRKRERLEWMKMWVKNQTKWVDQRVPLT